MSTKTWLQVQSHSTVMVLLSLRLLYYLLEGELGVAGRAGKTVDTPGLVQGRHH